MRRFPFLVVFIVMVAGVCGCGGDNDEAAAFDLPAAESCADLADMFVGSTQRMLDALGTRTDANMEGDLPADIEAASYALPELEDYMEYNYRATLENAVDAYLEAHGYDDPDSPVAAAREDQREFLMRIGRERGLDKI